MEYICILGRRIDLCACADSVGSYQADARANHGTSRMHRGGSGSLSIVSALAGFRRSGSERTAVRIRKSSLERRQGGGRSGRGLSASFLGGFKASAAGMRPALTSDILPLSCSVRK